MASALKLFVASGVLVIIGVVLARDLYGVTTRLARYGRRQWEKSPLTNPGIIDVDQGRLAGWTLIFMAVVLAGLGVALELA